MKGNQDLLAAMFSYISLEERVPQAHPLSKLRAMADALLATMNDEFKAEYARRGRPSISPEMLLKALLLQILLAIRSERKLVEAINLNLLYRWFTSLNIEVPVWDHSTLRASMLRLVRAWDTGHRTPNGQQYPPASHPHHAPVMRVKFPAKRH